MCESCMDGYVPAGTRMCQDTCSEVRQSMCGALLSLAKAVGPDVTAKSLVPELEELLKDEEKLVWYYV